MADQILAKGIRVFDKHSNAPEFVKASLVITIDEFKAFVNENIALLSEYQGKKQLKLQLLESKAGSLYLAVDTYKPGDKPAASKTTTTRTSAAPVNDPADDDLPF